MRTTDTEFIRAVMTHPRVWPSIADDHAGEAADFVPVVHDRIYYLAPTWEGRPIGVFMYHPHSTVLYEVHTCVLPAYWGAAALYGARASLRWMIDNTPCAKVITHVPQTNVRALRFARTVGMVDEGLNRESYAKDGILIDQYLLGITKLEIEECQQQR